MARLNVRTGSPKEYTRLYMLPDFIGFIEINRPGLPADRIILRELSRSFSEFTVRRLLLAYPFHRVGPIILSIEANTSQETI